MKAPPFCGLCNFRKFKHLLDFFSECILKKKKPTCIYVVQAIPGKTPLFACNGNFLFTVPSKLFNKGSKETPHIKNAQNQNFKRIFYSFLFEKINFFFFEFSQCYVQYKLFSIKCRCLRIRHSDDVSIVLP